MLTPIARHPLRLFAIAAICLATTLLAPSPSLQAQQSGLAHQPKVQIDLIAEKQAVRPGEEITIALRQRITPGWHTYWSNPGDSGEPTRIEWQLPPGASAGAIQWPLPHAIPVGPLMNFGYSDELLLLSNITVPENASGTRFDIQANAKWLVCEEICIPEEATASLSLPLADPSVSPAPSAEAPLIAKARETIPEPKPWPAQFAMKGDDVALKVGSTGSTIEPGSTFHFFPLKWGLVSHSAPQTASFTDGEVTLQLKRGDFASEKAPEALDGVLAVESRGADGEIVRRGYSLSAAPADFPVTPQTTTPAAGSASVSGRDGGLSLLVALGFSFLGGLILNLMPCVFPVLSLKALSLAKDAGNADARRTKGLVYLAGVLASFAAIGLALIALRSGGAAIGWGMQFQSPSFVLAMMALFLALGLNLSGVFSIGNSITGVGDSLTRRSGISGYFFTGVLATVVATPCTAPFMGAAMGYAFTQPATIIFAVLLMLGFGFAVPILLLSFTPALGRWLPKPGAWMETFKQVMAFPLYATVGWLLWVLSIQLGSDGVLAGILTLLGVGFAAWLFGRSLSAGLGRSAAAMLIAIAAVGAGIWSLTGIQPEQMQANAGSQSSGPTSEPFTQARLNELVGQRKPVFVNLTAAWCITCKVNERVALRSETFATALRDRSVTYLVGDWTNGNPEITALLKTHGRVGVPLYLLYSGIPGEKPKILPQLLTESIVLNRLRDLPSPVQQAKGDL